LSRFIDEVFMRTCVFLGTVGCIAIGVTAAPGAELPLILRDDFEQGAERWQTTDPDPSAGVWQVVDQPLDGKTNRVFRVTGPSKYQPPFRSPHSIALVRDAVVSDFALKVRVQNTNPTAGAHRDLCLFWGYQDPSHFYYVHLGAKPDPHSCQIFVVDGATRLKITTQESSGTPWSDGWHDVKVVRNVADGTMEVYFDDMTQPCMVARDTRFAWGRVGLGTFDDSGNFDVVELHGQAVEPPADRALPIVAAPATHGASIRAGDQPFAEYLALTGHQPAIWPLFGPSQQPMTRAYPMAELGESERDDHPHHRSVWFTHGMVNQYDFWLEPTSRHPQTLIKQTSLDLAPTAADGSLTLVAANDWMADGKKVLEDVRTWKFAATRERRWLDFTIELIASEGDVVFGDTKEGTFAVRVAGPMKVEAKQGGRIRNDRGQRDGATWGQPARWVDYSGPTVGGEAGIAMMSHPSNFRPECRWHVRTYGLFGANPFGKSDFPEGEPSQGAYTIPAGESLTLRYRIFLHDGTATDLELERVFEDYAAAP
jgi:hypothetical protein